MLIERLLNFKFPIYWSDWAIEKEFAFYLIYRIVASRPRNVVELGSGVSTSIILKTLKKLKHDYFFSSFDSDERFLEETKNLLRAEGIYDEQSVNLVHSPLRDIKINRTRYKWYNPNDFYFDFDKVDFLFVDGPIGTASRNARYPVLNIVRKYLGEKSIVILHDAKREDETAIVQMWKDENRDITRIHQIETERGGVEIQF